MKPTFLRPLAYFVPLAEGIDVQSLAALSEEQFASVWHRCMKAEEERIYQANPDVIEREIDEEYVLVPTGQYAQHFNGMIPLNIISHFIWKQFAQPRTLGDVLRAAKAEFDDPHHMLDIQVRKLVQDYAQMGVLVIVTRN